MFKVLVAAGIGGTLPTLCRLAAAYSVGGDPPFGFQVYVALGLYFMIGMAVVFGMGESELRKAFGLGIAAPAIVASIVNGATTPAKSSGAASGSPPTTELRYTHPDSLALLLGIGDAQAHGPSANQAQAQSLTGDDRPQVRVTSNLGRGATGAQAQTDVSPAYAIDPVALRFMSASGVVLESTWVDPRVAATVPVPPGATSVEAALDGKVSAAKLPSTPFKFVDLRLNIDTSRFSDFLWALGATRPVRVEGVSVSIANVAQQLPAPQPPSASSPEKVALTKGARVYSESGAPVGVVESVKTAAPGQAAQIVIRPEDSPSR